MLPASPAVPSERVREGLPLHPGGCAHLQRLHQALHLFRLQLCRDGPDEDTHGHVVHGRDVLCVDAPVFGLSHGCGCRPASAFRPAQPSPPLCPEQCSAQPGPFASSWPSHRHQGRRPSVLQSHSARGRTDFRAGCQSRWPAACSGELRSGLPSPPLSHGTHVGTRQLSPHRVCWGSLPCPLRVSGPTWPCWDTEDHPATESCPPAGWLYQEHVPDPEPPPCSADTCGVYGKEDEA